MKYFSESMLPTAEKQVFIEKTKIVFSFLLIAYSLKSAEISVAGVDSVLLVWVLLLSFLLSDLNKKSVIIAFVVYVILACFYMLGEMRSSNLPEGAGYIRIFPTGFILSSIFSMQLKKISSNSSGRVFNWIGKIDFLILFAIIYWIIFIAKAQTVVDYAVHEYGAKNYLTISDILALLSLSVIGDAQKKIAIRWLWLIGGLVAIMMLGSRASVLVFTLVALISISTVSQDNRGKLGVKHLIFAIVLISIVAYVFFDVFNETVTYRMKTLLDLGNDESAAGRSMLLETYFSILSSDPTCFIISCQPPLGNYAHNIFSVVQYFGFVGFLLIIFGCVLIVLAFIRGWRPWLASIFIYSLIQLMFFRSWTSMIFPIVVAYAITAFLFLRREKKKRLS